MFPFKKKSEASKPSPADEMRERVNKRLDETHTRIDQAIKEMKRRLAEKERLKIVAVAK